MNFALLGDNSAVVPLLRAIASHPDHTLSHVALAGDTSQAALQIAPAARFIGQWEELLSDAQLDAVIVAGHQEPVLEGAKRLAAAGKPLMILPDTRQGLGFVYELTLIRDELKTALYPVFPRRFSSPVCRLKEIIDSGRLGKVLHLQLERGPETSADSAASHLLSKSGIDQILLPDVDLLRFLAGDYNRVTALSTGVNADQVSLFNVTLAADGVPDASWSLKATQAAPLWKLMVIGDERTIALSRADDRSEFRLDADDVELAEGELAADGDMAERVLEQFVLSTVGEPARPDWSDLSRALELIDAVHRSVRRRRTIDVYFETASERSVFKTQMTAAGCGLLAFTLVAVMLLLAVGSLFSPSKTVMQILRILVFLPLFVFLLLQVLVLIARPSSVDERTEAPDAEADG